MSTADAPQTIEDLRTALDRSRGELLDALKRLTERDFAAPMGTPGSGETLVTFLATLAPAERADVSHAAAAVDMVDAGHAAGGPSTEGRRRAPTRDASGPVLPPQVIHDLAGARHETMRVLDRLRPSDMAMPIGQTTAGAVLAGVAERERAAARRIRDRHDHHTDAGPSSSPSTD